MERAIKILVPIDFSVCSENALTFTLRLASKIKANLLLLNALAFDSVHWEVDELIEQSRKRMKTSIKKAINSAHSFIDGLPSIQTSFEMGKAEATICSFATRNKVDYIIMGAHGEGSSFHKYLGSVASDVLKNAPCPVMVMSENTAFTKKTVIGYATEISEVDPFKIWQVIKLFKPFQPEIKCVHFNKKQGNNENKINELESYFSETAPELKITFYNLPLKDKVKDMNDFIENENINILAMYKPKRAFSESIFHKSYTQKMARFINIPVIVLPEV